MTSHRKLVHILYVVCCISAIYLVNAQQQPNRISRQRGNVLRNLTRTQSYQNDIVTSPLDASDGIRQVYRTLRDVYNKYLKLITLNTKTATIVITY